MQIDENDALPKKQQDNVALWGELTDRFHHLRDFVETMRLETEEEAIGEKLSNGQWRDKSPRWEDEDVGQVVRAWNLLPYVDALDQDEINDRIQRAKRLIPDLTHYFENRILTPAFMKMWGSFCSAAGTVEFLYFQTSDVGRKRSAKAGGDKVRKRSGDHKRWLAHYLLRFYEGRGGRGKAEFAVEQLIKGIINRTVPVDWDLEWFEHFLDFRKEADQNYAGLRMVYRERDFPLAEMRRLILQDPGDIPPLDLNLPVPLR
ncbi:hypothetical protein GCM10011491_19050 [Brucella endophytica]|uniref:Uncharacterized protein n=1 Tax=Brucella endophytica TaxID=1963359 RepID=A0A916SAB1_9HYPH|nr:hypothetical protein [Brucella endophytica]GGA91235.1 hypothetical protein GCM10011491_19050 [Brucella endophytica]